MTLSHQQIRFARSADGVRLAYALSGEGQPAIVKAATWLSHLEHDWNSPVWSHLLREMSRLGAFVRYDERGCGLSDWQVEDLSFESWVTDLEAVVQAAGAESFALLGISQGAAVAIEYACRYPERVTHLVLHGGYARGRLVRSTSREQREEAETMRRLAAIGWGKEDEAFRQFFTTQFIPGGTREQHAWFNELERLSTSPANAARFMSVFDTIDVTARLAQVKCPTLVLHSIDDVRVPFAEGRLLATSIPQAEFVPIESRNHLLLEDEPAWRVWLERVRAFLGDRQAPRFANLTHRQQQILELIAQARDNAQIAAVLGLSEKTVRNQVSAIMARLAVENRAQAIVAARDAGYGKGGAA